MIRAPVKPELLRWARERAGMAQQDLACKFKSLPKWEAGEIQPTLKQTEAFARAVHVPIGCLFLSEPPREDLPIPDYRNFNGRKLARPSPALLDSIYACQERQNWYRDFARTVREPALGFVASASVETPPEAAAASMRETLRFDFAARRRCQTWVGALRQLIRQADDAGILVTVSGIVRSNRHRRLDPAEFRGFALSDPLAPAVFVNGQDMKAAQMFTLAHQLARIWLGESALSNLSAAPRSGFRREEVWCGKVAAEFLVPVHVLQSDPRNAEAFPGALDKLAREFRVSTLVILRRMLDAGWLSRGQFNDAWAREHDRLLLHASAGRSRGGGLHRTTIARVGRRFAHALIESTHEGHTSYRDAFRMLDVKKSKTFDRLERAAGVAASLHIA